MLKKFSSIAIAVVMVLTMCVTAFAETDKTDRTDRKEEKAGQFGTLVGWIGTARGSYSSTVKKNDVGATLYAGAEIQNVNGRTLRKDNATSTGKRASDRLGWPRDGYAMYGAHYIQDFSFYTYCNTKAD